MRILKPIQSTWIHAAACLAVAFATVPLQAANLPALPDAGNIELWVAGDHGVLNQNDLPAGNGDEVKVWTDQSGNGNDLIDVSVPLRRPSFVTNGIGGNPSVSFDGVFDIIQDPMFVTTVNTLFVVFQPANEVSNTVNSGFLLDVNQSFKETIGLGIATGSVANEVVTVFSQTSGLTNTRSAYTSTTEALPSTSPSILAVSYNSGDSAFDIFLNGTNVRNATAGSDDTALNAIRFRLGGQFGSDAGTFFEGQVAEVIVYSSALNDANRQTVESYLTNKYAPVAAVPEPATVGLVGVGLLMMGKRNR